MGIEPFQPQWAELTEGFREERKILDEVLTQQGAAKQPQDEIGQAPVEANRYRSISAQQENHIGRLERALWLAEEELRLLQLRYRALREPVGRGRRRGAEPSSNERLIVEVDYLLQCAEQDQAEAQWREQQNLSSLPDWVNAVCGTEGLTIRQAVATALRRVHAFDDAGAQRSPEALQRLVEARYEAALKAYERHMERRRRRTSTDK